MSKKILVLNIGSTSTQVALFEDDKLYQEEKIKASENTDKSKQLEEREEHIDDFIKKLRIKEGEVSAIVSRGGIMRPLPAGVYIIDEQMCQDLKEEKYGSHPSAYGPIIAHKLSKSYNCPAYTVDPPSTDELCDEARISGNPLFERKSAFHALSHKAAAKSAAIKSGLDYKKGNFILAHLGGGITVGAHHKGRVIDASHGLSEGPMTPERSGNLPTIDLLDYVLEYLKNNLNTAFERETTSVHSARDVFFDYISDCRETLIKKLAGEGGIYAYLQTKDFEEVEKNYQQGDKKAELIIEAMAYQIAKEIGSMATVLRGNIDLIVLTGALINSKELITRLKRKVEFLSSVTLVPENEMKSLALGALRILNNLEKPQQYS